MHMAVMMEEGREDGERKALLSASSSALCSEQSLMVWGGGGNCKVTGDWEINFCSSPWVGSPPEVIRQEELHSWDGVLILNHFNLCFKDWSFSLLICFITVISTLYLGKKNTGPGLLSVAYFNHFFTVRGSCRDRENLLLLHDTSGAVFRLSMWVWWNSGRVHPDPAERARSQPQGRAPGFTALASVHSAGVHLLHISSGNSVPAAQINVSLCVIVTGSN